MRIKCKQPPYACIGESCPQHPPQSHFACGGAMVGGCKDYPGYGYCYNKKYGRKLARQIYYVEVGEQPTTAALVQGVETPTLPGATS